MTAETPQSRSRPPSADVGSRYSIEGELLRSNRELAQIRDQLRQRERELQDWKNRHSELVVRLADVDGELTKTRARARRSECSREQLAAAVQVAAPALEQLDEGRPSELLEQANHRLEALLEEASDLRHERDQAQTVCGETQTLLSEAKQKIETLLREAEGLRYERHEAQIACREAEAGMGDAKQKVETLLLEAEGLRQERQQAQDTCGKAQAELGQTQQQVEAMRWEIEDLRQERHEAEIAGGAAQAALLQAEQEMQSLRKQTEDLHRERQEVEDACGKAQAELLEVKVQSPCREKGNGEASETHSACAEAQERSPTLISEMEELERLNSVMAAQTSRLKNAKIHQRAAELDHGQVVRELANGWRARQEVEAELCKSAQALEVEHTLRTEVQEAKLQVAALEEELAARLPPCRSSQLESRVRTLQTENNALRSEVIALKRQGQEFHEGLGMLSEESRTRQLEAAFENSRLQIQLEESRRARKLEIDALVTKMYVDRLPSANKIATGVAC